MYTYTHTRNRHPFPTPFERAEIQYKKRDIPFRRDGDFLSIHISYSSLLQWFYALYMKLALNVLVQIEVLSHRVQRLLQRSVHSA